jgi:hypothetical protein
MSMGQDHVLHLHGALECMKASQAISCPLLQGLFLSRCSCMTVGVYQSHRSAARLGQARPSGLMVRHATFFAVVLLLPVQSAGVSPTNIHVWAPLPLSSLLASTGRAFGVLAW